MFAQPSQQEANANPVDVLLDTLGLPVAAALAPELELSEEGVANFARWASEEAAGKLSIKSLRVGLKGRDK